jgi:hypothetical protein
MREDGGSDGCRGCVLELVGEKRLVRRLLSKEAEIVELSGDGQ